MKIPVGPLDLLIIQGSPFCNIDCKYCYLPNRLDKSKIKFETVEIALKKIFEEKLVHKEFSIVWHAGEPLAMPIDFYRRVYQLLKEIVPENINVIQHIQSNATLLTQEWCDFIKESGIKIGISIDGPQFLHDANRITRSGKGTFAAAMAGAKLLQQNEIEFSVIMVITEKALDYPVEIFNFFKELGTRSLGFNIDEEDGANTTSTIQQPQEVRLKHFWKTMYQLQMQPGNYIHIREIFGFNEMLLNIDLKKESMHLGQMLCPYKIITMDTKGDYTTFSPELIGMKDESYGNFTLGNVHTDSFRDALQTDKFKKMFGEIMQGVTMCKNTCDYFHLCGGGAPSNKLYENKSFATTETNFCKYSRKIIIDSIMESMEEVLIPH